MLKEPISPWKYGKNPEELLDPAKVKLFTFPLESTSFANCVLLEEFLVCPNMASYKDAIEMCLSLRSFDLDSSLITLKDQDKFTEFRWDLSQISDKPFWLYLSDHVEEGVFVWGDGTPLGTDYWHPGEPNNRGGHEDCATMNWDGSSGWNDVSCDAQFGVVCSFE